LINGRNIRSSSTLSNILVLDGEVLAYSAPTTSCSHILVANDFEVLALALLHKGNSSGFGMDNPTIELEIIVGSEAFTLLS
jgi:hypothetical protein